MTTLDIFIIANAENPEAVREAQCALTDRGHRLEDLTHAAQCLLQARDQRGILPPVQDRLFDQLTLQLATADLFVLVGAPDFDAAVLVGMANISGVPIAYLGDPRPCSLMVRGCVNLWLQDVAALLETLGNWPQLNGDE